MLRDFPVSRILIELESDNLTPAIIFRSARRQCDLDLEKLAEVPRLQLKEKAQEKIRNEIFNIIRKYGFQEDVIESSPYFDVLVKYGVGAHHAGQLLAWRLLLEELMSRGMLRLLIATGTVAAGVDFPARSVVITAHSKRGNEGFKVILPSELQQMSGRAGRRGKDTVGFCIVAPGQFADARVIHDLSRRPPEPLKSSYFASPSTALNLLKYRHVDDLKFTVERSLAAFLDRKKGKALREEAAKVEVEAEGTAKEEAKKRIQKRARRIVKEAESVENKQITQLNRSLEGLEALGHIKDGKLTDKGTWAAELCTTLVLELAEAVEKGLFDDASLHKLVGLVASIAGDHHRHYFNLSKNPLPEANYEKLRDVIQSVRAVYQNPATEEAQVVPDAANTVLTWMDSPDWGSFSSLLRLAKVAEGDAARVITQTADHLNQLSRLYKTHPVLAAAAEEGRRRILRPPVSDAFVVEE